MRFLVLGATGMAGHTISIYLSERGHEVWGYSRRKAGFLQRSLLGDALAISTIASAIDESRPDVIVNCIALLNADCDKRPDLAVYLNSYLPHWLAHATERSETRVFHISSDGIFAGNGGPYDERSVPDGESLYFRTKALGELRNGKDLTLRTSVVGPDIDPGGIGLLNWFMAQSASVKGWTGAIWTGLTSLELARAIEACAIDGSAGLVNMVPDGPGISKADLLRLFSEHMCGGGVEVVDDDSVQLDKTLVRTALPDGYRPQGYVAQIADMAKWIDCHQELYPDRYRRRM